MGGKETRSSQPARWVWDWPVLPFLGVIGYLLVAWFLLVVAWQFYLANPPAKQEEAKLMPAAASQPAASRPASSAASAATEAMAAATAVQAASKAAQHALVASTAQKPSGTRVESQGRSAVDYFREEIFSQKGLKYLLPIVAAIVLWCLWCAYRCALIGVGGVKVYLRSGAAEQVKGAWAKGLLPGQVKFVEKLVRRISGQSGDKVANQLFALAAVWGGGKTTIVNGVIQLLKSREDLDKVIGEERDKRDYVPVLINGWREEHTEHLHFSVVQQIVLKERVWKEVKGVLSTRLLAGVAKGRPLHHRSGISIIAGAIKEISLGFKATVGTANIDANLKTGPMLLPVPLDYQEDLNRILKRLRQKRIELVIFVDEIERGTPRTAQAMLVLLRRGLDMEGIQIVMPYVPEILTKLAFDPLVMESPDLKATALAVLSGDDKYHAQAVQQAAQRIGFPNGSVSSASGIADKPAEPAQAAGTDQPAASSNAAADLDKWWAAAANAYKHSLFTGYLKEGDDPDSGLGKKHLDERIREKYLGARWALPKQSAEDLTAFVMRRSEWRVDDFKEKVLATARAIAGSGGGKEETNWEELFGKDGVATARGISLVKGFVEDKLDLPRSSDAAKHLRLEAGQFSLRTFEGEVSALLNAWEKAEGFRMADAEQKKTEGNAIAELIAMLIVLAVSLTNAKLQKF